MSTIGCGTLFRRHSANDCRDKRSLIPTPLKGGGIDHNTGLIKIGRRTQPIAQIVLAQGVYGLEVISGRNVVDDADTALSEDLAVDGCGLLAGHDERQAWLSSLLGPAHKYLLRESVLATWAEIVRLVDYQPDFHGNGGR